MVSGTDYDALADLFLSEGMLAGPLAPKGMPDGQSAPGDVDGTRPPDAPMGSRTIGVDTTAPEARVEALILGHLPVYAAPWATQYARQVGEELGGPVALVRVQGGKATLDVVGPSDQVEVGEDLGAGIARAGAIVRSWLIRVDEMSEAALAGVAGIDRVSVLSGADQAALTSTYRTLKYLHEQVRSSEAVPPTLRVVLMGADAPRAHEACEKLRQTTLRFLGEPVEIVVGPRQMSPAAITPVCKPVASPEVAEIVALARRAGVAAPAQSRASSSVAARPSPPTMDHAMAGSDPVRSTRVHEMPMGDTPPSTVTPLDEAGSARPRLSAHLQGLTSLPLTCPYATDVELAADPRGVVHALSRVEGGKSPGEVISRLVSVSAWVTDHLAILRMAVPAARLSPQGPEATLHLFTDDPKGVRRLLDGPVRLHFLAGVALDGRTAWVCREIN